MLFHSATFLFAFLPFTLLGYWTIRRRAGLRPALVFLTLASLVFYGWKEPHHLLLLLGALIVNWSVARLVTAQSSQPVRKALTILIIGADIGLIFWFKYSVFIVEAIGQAIGQGWEIEQLALPLAISFFSFELIAFAVDNYRKRVGPVSFLEFCLFISFFPQLIAGPIVHHRDLIPQFRTQSSSRGPSRAKIAMGLGLFSIGLVKKTQIGDPLSGMYRLCEPALAAATVLDPVSAWSCVSAAALHIYFDYSGYADMAMGLALWFGIRLPHNFLSPFKATSIAGFWRRWNLTLMRFLRNHIYIPIGGRRHGPYRQALAILITMVVCGFWHGSGWNYLYWGACVGAMLAIEALLGLSRPCDISSVGAVTTRLVVFIAFVFPLTFFLRPSLDQSFAWLDGLLGLAGRGQMGIDFHATHLPVLALALAVVYGLPNTYQLFSRFRPGLTAGLSIVEGHERSRLRWRPSARWAVAVGLFLSTGLLALGGDQEFFYFQF